MKDIISMLNSQIKEYINRIKELENKLSLAEECIQNAKKESFLGCERAYEELSRYTKVYGKGN
jgi:hypothetical protein